MNNPQRFLVAASLSLATALVNVGCSSKPELEFADWILPVPAGTPIKEYAPVRREERDPDAIVLVEDLVIGGDPDSIFYSTPQITVADDGTIFVLDRNDHSVRAFDTEGKLVRKFGRKGQGPGEMDYGRGITIAGDHLLIADGLTRTRILVFTLDGEPVESHQTQSSFGLHFYGVPDGTFVNSTSVRVEDRSRRRVAGRYSRQGEELQRYLDLDGTPPRELPNTRDRTALMAVAIQDQIKSSNVRPVNLQTTGERVYAILGDQYEVLAMDLEGTPLWGLRVAWQRPPFGESFKKMTRSQAERYDLDPETLEFPEFGVAVTRARVDGRGRLYVYPNVGDQPEDDPYVPIDVYSPEGEVLASGLGPAGWVAAHGDYVYSFRHEEETDNWYVIRHRLLLNGQ